MFRRHITSSLRLRYAAQWCRRSMFSVSSMLLGKVVSYKLADIGEGITEVQVLNVKVKPGDRLREFDPICEVQSDKATVDITSRFDGVVQKVHIVKGATTLVGSPLIDIELDGEETSPTPTNAAAAAATTATAPPAGAAASGTKIVPYKLADIGEGITEVQVLQVFVKAGDRVREFDRICEVQSDKATVEVTSRFDGLIKDLLVEAGKPAKVGQIIANFEVALTAGEAAKTASSSSSPEAGGQAAATAASSKPAVTSGAAASTGKVLATPATRYLAKERHVDLRLVPATGKGGRITKEDLLRYVAQREQQAAAPQTSAMVERPASDLAAVAPAAAEVLHRPIAVDDVVVPLVGVRRGMVKSMTQAASIPTFSCTEEYDLTQLIALRATLKERVQRRSKGELKLSITPFFIKAASIALREYPDINAHVIDPDCASFVRKAAHNIGFAMDTPSGLTVPVIKGVEQKSILQIAQDMQTFMERGRQGRLSLEDLSGGTFTLSNIGTIGATVATPVVMPPQVAIGAICRLQKLPRYNKKGELYPANIVTMTFSADHRIIDGATMVRFAVTLKNYLENPGEMLLDLQ